MRGLRDHLAPLITLLLFAVLAGAPFVQVPLRTVAVSLALPDAAGVPFGVPPLWLIPVGTTTGTFWTIDIVAALLMLLVVALRLCGSVNRHPGGGRGRAFVAALGGCLLGVLAGNLVRGVAWSFITDPGLGTYLGYLVANLVLAAFVGLAVGLVVGAVAALTVPARHSVVNGTSSSGSTVSAETPEGTPASDPEAELSQGG